MRKKAPRQKSEPTITLINIVFLMLIFFLVAGTLAQPLDSELSLVRAADLTAQPPANALVIDPQGALSFRGAPMDGADAFMQALPETDRAAVRIVPDRDLPAADLVRLGNQLRAAGAEQVILVTERGLE